MTPYIPIPSHTSQRAHAAAGHVSRVKSAATGASTVAGLRSALVHSKLARQELQALESEVKLMIRGAERV